MFVGKTGQRNLADGLGLVVAEVGQKYAAAVDGQVGDLASGIAILRWNRTRGVGVELGGAAHGDGHARRIGCRAVGCPDTIGDGTRSPVADFQFIADDRCWRGRRRRHWSADRNQFAGCIKCHCRSNWINCTRTGRRGTVRVATVDQGIGIPSVRPSLDHVLIHGVLVTLSVENRGTELLGESFLFGRIEFVGGDRLVNLRCRRVQVDRRRNSAGGFRRQVGGVDPQVGQHAIDDLAVGIHTVTLQAGSTVAVGDIAVLVGLERTGTGVGQRTVVAQDEEAIALDTHVEHVASVAHVTLAELLGNVGQAHAVADGLAAGAKTGRRVHVFEFCAGRFETGGRDVGDVVAGHVQLFVGCKETAKADIERHHPLLYAGLVGFTYQWFVLWTGQYCPARPD
ncbi:hypothetical protein D3C80_458120 [compost metagenome]